MMNEIIDERSDTARPPDQLREVIPGRLWQSGSRVAPEHADLFDAVVSVGNERQAWEPGWMERAWDRIRPKTAIRLPLFLHAPLIDAGGFLDAPTAASTARHVVQLIHDGRRVLIHCDAGAFRSVFMAALVLSAVEGIPGLEACERVDECRGRRYRIGIGIRDFDEMLATWPHPS
jgi:hypothetical protein